MYLPEIIENGSTHVARNMELGKEYLLTLTGVASAGSTVHLEFLHGVDPVWRRVDTSAHTDDVIIPLYCNGRLRVVTTGGTANAPIYTSMHPIISRNES